ncbi:hypothetical protein BH24PSE2_BH24PSE2_16910 [soil metagenome]
MYAVIKTGGKQYRVREGGVLRVERLAADAGASVTFDRVLAIGSGEDVRIGAPLVEGGQVTAVVRGHGKARKIEVVKFKRRQNYRRTIGHRQAYTEIEVTGIAAEGLKSPRESDQDVTDADQPAAESAAQKASAERSAGGREQPSGKTKTGARAKVKQGGSADKAG